ncbi:polyhydroxyalkanoate synthesis repressor PhaR [Azospirillum isscasi]|uniref:Polyhydroxyalkanoate synthesis repressor PhaR n=1 Tax=Azospirillum isscasi TaxID=3053926 RepID=A0ABU0WJ62_9PROT|nr:polyhydroxyalkanoate synthesis repressor PhaR [Azospirillum isscasi]MDQ2103897.1 polyhydroxyalkanoate synthesis repressor PhaR [Azospirillum isscasi]
MADKEEQKSATITIKKYANRRLYNTATSSYVTLDHLCQMVKDGLDFVVYDAKTGEDITRSVLTQIIVEEESKGQNLLPISFLRQLIGFYGDNMQWMVPRYLEYSMQSFSRNQEQMRDYFQNTLGGMFPFGRLEEVGKQNMAMFERAMRMFSPFGGAEDGHPGEHPVPPRPAAPAPSATPSAVPASANHTYEELQKQIDDLQKQIASIAKPARPAKPEGK